MENVRVLNREEDYKKLGLKPHIVEQWEDGRRRPSVPGAMENWYFDAIMSDGTKVVVSFRPRTPEKMQLPGDEPNLNIHISTPDGKNYDDFITIPIEECETREGECHVQYGPHSFIGDLVDYRIKVEPINGIGCDLHLHVQVKPFRPGTGYVAFGDNPSKEYTWTCFPRGTVEGNVTVDGKTYDVHGLGYHDHQYHNTDPMAIIHHWLWGRQNLEDYTVVIFDIVANEKYGFTQVPIFGIIDKEGNVIFENLETAKTEIVERYFEEETQKYYPKIIKYTFENEDTTVTYTIKWIEELEVRSSKNIFVKANEEVQKKLALMGLDPSYLRYHADAELVITQNGKTNTAKGDMIYEFAYFGKPDPRAHLEEGSNNE